MGVSALGPHLGPIHPQPDARGWTQGPVSGQAGRSGFQCWPGALRQVPNPGFQTWTKDSHPAQIRTRQEPLAHFQWTSSLED